MIRNTLTYMRAYLGRYLKNEKGQAMVEYGLIIALIAIVVITAVMAIGTNLDTVFQNIADKLVTP